MTARVFILLNLALAFYLVGAIWAHEVDIFRSWKLIAGSSFTKVQAAHWRVLPYWILLPLGIAFVGSVVLIWYHPAESPIWGIWGNLLCQIVSHILTAMFWGPWQARLAADYRGSASPYLDRILASHWIRTLLINLYGLILLAWSIQSLG